MILKYKYKFLTYMAIVIVSCIVFNFLLSVNQGAQSEQTYEMTDHKIHQHNQKELLKTIKTNKIANRMISLCSH